MKQVIILSLLFILFAPAFTANAKPKKVPPPAPPAVECVALMETLQGIHMKQPIATAMAVEADVGDQLRDWLGKMPPTDKTPYDLVVVVTHQSGQYSVLVGWRKDLKLGAASLCAGLLVGPERAAEFEKITGLKSQLKDEGSI